MVEELQRRGQQKQLFRLLEFILIVATVMVGILFLLFLLRNANATVEDTLLDYRFILVLIFLIASAIIHAKGWRMRIEDAKENIVHAVVYRAETPINKLADSYNISTEEARRLLQQLLEEDRLDGEIRGNFFYASLTREPECTLCHQDILNSERFFSCPYCKAPFHKDCFIDYINEVEEICPNCARRVTLVDIFGEKPVTKI